MWGHPLGSDATQFPTKTTALGLDSRFTKRLQKFRMSRPYLLQWKRQLLSLAKQKVKVKLLSRVRLFAIPWSVTYQAPPTMRFSRQECWSGLPFPSPGDLSDPGIEPRSPALQADALTSQPSGKQCRRPWFNSWVGEDPLEKG